MKKVKKVKLFFLLMMFVVMMSSCSISNDCIEYSKDLCEVNGGLQKVYIGGVFVVEAECKNEAKFEVHTSMCISGRE